MTNYIRACFCTEQPLPDTKLNVLVTMLGAYDCHPVGVSEVFEQSWTMDFAWEFSDKRLQARFLQIWHTSARCGVFFFDVVADAFMPGRTIFYTPGKDRLFSVYKLLLTCVIGQIVPSIGVIDYEADLTCPWISNSRLA